MPARTMILAQLPSIRSTVLCVLLAWLTGTALAKVPQQSTANTQSGGVQQANTALDTAVFAGGCFWCMEAPFDQIPGVNNVTVGYMGGATKNPTYEEVSAGTTGHAEVVRIVFDPRKVSYTALLGIFWRQIDPLTANAQFCDQGSQYRSAIFFYSESQKQSAWESLQELEKSGRFKSKIVTEIVAAGDFYAAEDYHQQYYKKNPVRYKYYRHSCGRDQRLDQLWGTDREKL